MSEVGHIFPDDAAKQVVEVGKAIKQTDDYLLNYTFNLNKLIETLNQNKISLKDLIDVQKKVAKTTEDIDRVGKKLLQSEKNLNDIEDKRYETIIKNREEVRKQTQEMKQNVNIANSQAGSYTKLTNTLNKNIAKWKSLSEEERNNSKIGGQLLNTIKKQDSELKKLDSQIGRSQRQVGNYAGAIKRTAMQFAGALGLTNLVFVFANVLKGSFSTVREFTKENAVLAGVLGTTRKEIKQLTNQAIELGSIYPITASEVNKLQVSYARLGFTQSEIISLTEATIQGSIALNSSLDQTATLVGAVVKAFSDLGTADAPDIVDKLTLATQRSALSFSSLETGVPKVAAAASALGVTLETMLAQLGTAQDATLDASIASTSLRNIYLELSKRGLTLAEGLEIINTSSNKLTASYELFGKRAAIVGLALANNIEKTNELDEALQNSGGTAKRVAEEQMNTLDGAIKGASSSWEKYTLSLRKSEGLLTKIINSWTLALNTFTNKDIPLWRKNVELFTFGLVKTASKEQNKISNLQKKLSTATAEQIQFTIEKRREELENGTKIDRLLLKMLEDRLVEQRKVEEKNQKDAAKREENAKMEAELQKIAIEKEAAEKAAEIRKEEEEKANKEIEKERKRHANELRSIDEKVLNETSKFQAKERVRQEKEVNEQTKHLEIDDLQRRIDIREERSQNEQNYADREQEIAEQKAHNIASISQQLAFTIEDFANGRIESFKEFSKQLLLIGLEAVEKQILITQVEILAKEIASKSFAGIATSALLIAGIQVAFAGARAAIQGFEHGTDNAPGEFIAGEGNKRELMKLRTGELMMVEKPTHFKGNKYKGATIYSNPETEKIIKESGKNNNFIFDTKELKSELIAVRKAIQNKPVSIIDNRGNIIGKATNNYREIYINRLNRES